MFIFAEKVVSVGMGAAEWCVGSFFIDKESFGQRREDGPERDLHAFIADASDSTVKFSADSAAPDGLLCDRRRCAGIDC
jgi:hypothetical protein